MYLHYRKRFLHNHKSVVKIFNKRANILCNLPIPPFRKEKARTLKITFSLCFIKLYLSSFCSCIYNQRGCAQYSYSASYHYKWQIHVA